MKCRELHAIAFLQWRRKYPSLIRPDEDTLIELLEARIKNLHDKINPK